MSTTALLAWRNLWRNGRRTWLTVGAMVFCNALLVFLISFQLGSYSMMIDGNLSVLTGHLQIQHPGYNEDPKMRYSVANGVELTEQLRDHTGIESMAARGVAFALASSEERSFGIQIMGVQPDFESLVSTIPGLIAEGRYLQQNTPDEIVIGSVLARNLKVEIGDELTFLGAGRDASFAAGIATVVGIIDTGMNELDRTIAQIPLAYFQSIFTMEGAVHSIVINAGALDAVAPLKQKLKSELHDEALQVLDWNELQPGLKQAIQADMFSAFAMYAVLIVLVALSVLNTQLMSVLERTREFGVMMALGVHPGKLSRLVLLETALMSCLGLIMGCALGAIVTVYFQYNGLYIPGMEEAMEKYNLPGRLYPQLSFSSLLGGPSVVFLGGILAAIYPGLRLYSLQPVTAMRAV